MKLRSLLLSVVSLGVVLSSSLLSAQATVGLNPTTLAFGNQEQNVASAPLPVTMTNTGNATLTGIKFKFTGNNATDFSQTNNCTTSLAAGASCVINVVFTPLRSGNRNGNLYIADSAANTPQLVPMTGVGLSPVVLIVPQSLVFGSQAIGSPSVSQNIVVTNTGQATLKNISFSMTGANPGDFSQTNNCGTSLAIGATCTVTATFTPTGPWSRSAGIFLSNNALGAPQVMGVMGNGVSGGIAGFSPSTVTFPTRLMGTTSPATPVTLSNTGTAPLVIAAISAAGDYAQTNNCGTSVAAGSSCVINVTFTPSYNAARLGWINVNFVDPAGIQTIALTGAGALPNPIAVKPKAGSITFAQTQQFSAYLTNVLTTNVTWYVDNVVGGNSTVGTITTAGLYTPPATGGTHNVTAANIANPAQKATVALVVSSYPGTFTHHNDTFRTGQNNNEPALTTGNVNKVQFGKLFKQPVDGQIYGEPLWVPNVPISGQGTHNIVIVATQHDSVYAFDADALGAPLWHAVFTNAAAGITTIPRADIEVGLDISPEIGVTSTPVVDPVRKIVFVEARTKEVTGTVTNYVHKLHALDITTGKEKAGSPIAITANVPGTGYDNVGGIVSFNPVRQNNRSALLISNNIVYIAFSSLEDINPYHGWILGYNEDPLTQSVVFNYTPNGSKAGIWHGGGGIPADASGNLYATTGTGSFDQNVGGGISFVKMAPVAGAPGTLNPVDYFSPFNQTYLNLEAINADISASGPMLLPDQAGSVGHEAIACGKTGTIYLVNRENMGHYSATADNVVQSLYTTIGTSTTPSGNWGTPAFFNGQVYIQGIKDTLKQYGLYSLNSTSPAILSGGPLVVGADIAGYPGTTPVISSNGLLNGIVWVVQADGAASGKPATMRAFDANNVTHELYNTTMNGTTDNAGPGVKFATPTVANGKVYVPTASELDVYGLKP